MSDTSSLQLAAGLLTGGEAVGSFVSEQRSAGAIDTAADFNTKLATLQAQDAILRGNASARRAENETTGVVGRARASMAAQGVDLGSGSALDVQAQDAGIGAFDAQMIRNNAAREAWGITTEATLGALGQRQRADSIRAQSFDTLATGAARTYGLFANPKPDKTNGATGITIGQAATTAGDPVGGDSGNWSP